MPGRTRRTRSGEIERTVKSAPWGQHYRGRSEDRWASKLRWGRGGGGDGEEDVLKGSCWKKRGKKKDVQGQHSRVGAAGQVVGQKSGNRRASGGRRGDVVSISEKPYHEWWGGRQSAQLRGGSKGKAAQQAPGAFQPSNRGVKVKSVQSNNDPSVKRRL